MKQEGGGKMRSLLHQFWKNTTGQTDKDKEEASSNPAEMVDELFKLKKEAVQKSDKEEPHQVAGKTNLELTDVKPIDVKAEAVKPADVKAENIKLTADNPITVKGEKSVLTDAQPEDDHHLPGDFMKVKRNYLEALRSNIALGDLQENVKAYFSDFTFNGKVTNGHEKIFLSELQKLAKSILEQRKAAALVQTSTSEGTPVQKPNPINTQVCVKLSLDQMTAWVFIFPPENGGKQITEELIMEALNGSGVKRGVDTAVIRQMAMQQTYLKLAVAAVGKPAVDGIEGKIIDHYPRVERNKFEEQEALDDSSVNYKDLNWLHQVSENDIICDLVFPVNGEDGYLVNGQVLKAKQPDRLNLPNGENVVLNEEKNALIARITGTMFFEKGKFLVKDVLNIMSDVDLTVGNLDVIGNLVVNGDVISGFNVKATGNITIRGMVGNSVIIAGGNIKIGMGVRGCGEALLKAGETIQCVYMENCRVWARGVIESGSIINCDVISDDSVVSKNIVGGSITALHSVTATTIGNQQRRQTVFHLGITQQTLQEKTALQDQSKALKKSISQAEKNIRFLESKEKRDSKEERQLAKLVAELAEQQKADEEGDLRLEEINEAIGLFSQCELTAKQIFPPVTVMIRSDSLIIEKEQSMCRVWSDTGEIRMT